MSENVKEKKSENKVLTDRKAELFNMIDEYFELLKLNLNGKITEEEFNSKTEDLLRKFE